MDEGKLMTSTELVQAAGTTRKALRVYQSRGLLAPVRDRGNRRYDADGLARLKLIVALRKLDLGVDSIGVLFASSDGTPVGGAAASRLAEELGDIISLAAARIRELQRIRDDLVAVRESLGRCEACERSGSLCPRCIEARLLDRVAEVMLAASPHGMS